MTQEFKVGDIIRNEDYDRLPVGSKVELGLGFAVWTKSADGIWRDPSGVVAADGEIKRFNRTLTYLPDAPEPEDTDDVEPEPLKEGDWVQVWARVEDEQYVNSESNVLLSVVDIDDAPGNVWARHDAIVRPDAGQVPPWVKPVEEPKGLGAVVDAEHAGEDVRFVRVGGDDTRHPWYAWLDERSYYTDWTFLKDPKVRSEGYVAGGAA